MDLVQVLYTQTLSAVQLLVLVVVVVQGGAVCDPLAQLCLTYTVDRVNILMDSYSTQREKYSNVVVSMTPVCLAPSLRAHPPFTNKPLLSAINKTLVLEFLLNGGL